VFVARVVSTDTNCRSGSFRFRNRRDYPCNLMAHRRLSEADYYETSGAGRPYSAASIAFGSSCGVSSTRRKLRYDFAKWRNLISARVTV